MTIAQQKIIKVIKYLSSVKDATQSDIEKNCEISQPDTSLAIMELEERGIVRKIRIISKKGIMKGGPTKVYTLMRNLTEIKKIFLNEIEEKYQKEKQEVITIFKEENKCLNDY